MGTGEEQELVNEKNKKSTPGKKLNPLEETLID